jgi:transposase InsO family protein
LIDIAEKDRQGCRTAHPDRIDCVGWEFVHVCIDDASRIAFVQIMANQGKESAAAFLEAAVAYYAKLGIRIERVMTDNGSCYRSTTFRAVSGRLGIRQIFTKPYTPRTKEIA